MRIGGFIPTTLLDYPGHLACTVFTQGCNLRCPYCQNGGLVLPERFEPPLAPENILARLRKRRGILEGVCISGGEPTLQPDLADFLREIKSLGLRVKLDTNGSHPDILRSLLAEGLLDYVAMDVKAAPSQYAAACGLADTPDVFSPYRSSMDLLRHAGIDYEFRTTLVRGLHTPTGIRELTAILEGSRAWYLQSYEESGNVIALLQGSTDAYGSFSPEELAGFLAIARELVPSARLRGVNA